MYIKLLIAKTQTSKEIIINGISFDDNYVYLHIKDNKALHNKLLSLLENNDALTEQQGEDVLILKSIKCIIIKNQNNNKIIIL